MTTENFEHRSHELNPRKWPIGSLSYPNPSNEKIWLQLKENEILLSNPEQLLIQDIPRILGPGNYANLGHARGGSACLLASSLREYNLKGKIYSIDLKWRPRSERSMIRLNLQKFITKCKGSTKEWAKKLASISFNFVFIDADHCYNAVVQDFNNWSPLVKKCGLISFHDTNQNFSHQAINTTVMSNKNWKECKELHIHRIRTFKKIN